MVITDEAVLKVLRDTGAASTVELLRDMRGAGLGETLSERHRYVNDMFARGALKASGDLRQANTIQEVYLRPTEIPCEVHDWSTKGMGKRLVEAAKRTGGVNACRECIDRARVDAAQNVDPELQPRSADVR